jgi:hypothetical protein
MAQVSPVALCSCQSTPAGRLLLLLRLLLALLPAAACCRSAFHMLHIQQM